MGVESRRCTERWGTSLLLRREGGGSSVPESSLHWRLHTWEFSSSGWVDTDLSRSQSSSLHSVRLEKSDRNVTEERQVTEIMG